MSDKINRPSELEAINAVKTLISWAGDNPDREGLKETPKRVIEAYKEFFSGYGVDISVILGKTFSEIENYEEIVLLKNMRFESHCEHHMAPFIGIAHIAYIPDKKVVGISKIARLLDVFAKRLQTQETMTSQIANALQNFLHPKGVAVLIDAEHQCMTTRGIHKPGTTTVTTTMLGNFKQDHRLEEKFLQMIK
ncbi:MAG: folE [Rickettsiaceae bacterium]|jgi:GTP cyclohydrolase I|nr:folE [Rickettsiaceae bacterium]